MFSRSLASSDRSCRDLSLGLLSVLCFPFLIHAEEVLKVEVPSFRSEQVLLDSQQFAAAGEMAYAAFPDLVRLSPQQVLISYKRGRSHASDPGAVLEVLTLNAESHQVSARRVIGSDPQQIYQMGEWIEFPDGSLATMVDLQHVVEERGRRQNRRTGIVCSYTRDAGQSFTPMQSWGPVDGVNYGYVFDSVINENCVYLLAMSFPELNSGSMVNAQGEKIYGEVSALSSCDQGKTWQHVRNLSQEFGGLKLNESTLVADGAGFIVVTRGYDDQARIHRVDRQFQLLSERNLTSDCSLIESHLGRPRLFFHDGNLYLLGRNWRSRQMELILLRLNQNTLAVERFIRLDPVRNAKIQDGYYAVPYFQADDGGLKFNVVTYRRPVGQSGSDLLRLEYRWDELR